MESVGKYSLKQHAEESPQITQIYTDIGYGEEGHESHGRSTRNICDNPWNLWETFSQAKSVRICEICGTTFSSCVRRSLPQITQIYTDEDAYRDNINTIKNKKKNKFREEYEECSYNCERGNGQHHPAL